MTSIHEVLVIGGATSGVGVAHTLLKKTLPLAKAKNTSTTYHVTMLSTTPDFFWNIASPRSLINDTLIPNNKIFASIPESFKKYGEQFTFVHGAARSIDLEGKTVSIQNYTGDNNTPTTVSSLRYDSLTIASGTRTNDPVWRPGNGSKATQLARFDLYRKTLPTAQTIILGGNGPVGVETAGEIGFEYKNRDITLISSSDRVLPGLTPAVGKFAEKILGELQVKLLHNTKVTSHEVIESSISSEGNSTRTKVTLSTGEILECDIYIDCTGNKPNSDFIPSQLLDSDGYIVADSNLRTTVKDVYAVGDIVSNTKRTAIEAGRMIPVVAGNVLFDLTAGKSGKDTKYEPMTKEMMVVPIGRKRGAGSLFGFNMFSFMVWFIKGRTYFVEMFEKQVSGAAY